jgi:hypothetical protein
MLFPIFSTGLEVRHCIERRHYPHSSPVIHQLPIIQQYKQLTARWYLSCSDMSRCEFVCKTTYLRLEEVLCVGKQVWCKQLTVCEYIILCLVSQHELDSFYRRLYISELVAVATEQSGKG